MHRVPLGLWSWYPWAVNLSPWDSGSSRQRAYLLEVCTLSQGMKSRGVGGRYRKLFLRVSRSLALSSLMKMKYQWQQKEFLPSVKWAPVTFCRPVLLGTGWRDMWIFSPGFRIDHRTRVVSTPFWVLQTKLTHGESGNVFLLEKPHSLSAFLTSEGTYSRPQWRCSLLW